MAKQSDYYDEVLKRIVEVSRRLRALEDAKAANRPQNWAQQVRALRRELLELTDEKYRTERGLRRRDIDLDFGERPARKTGKTEERFGAGIRKERPTGKVEAGPTGKVEARTGKMEAPTGKVEARPRATGKVKAKAAQATGKVEAVTGKVEAKAARGLSKLGRAGKVLKGAGRVAGKFLAAEEATDLAVEATDRQAKTVARGFPSMSLGGLPGVQITPRGPLRAESPPTVQPLFEKARKYMPTALAQAAATAGHGSYQEIQRRYQPMMSNIIQDLESRVTPMMSDEEVQGMLKRSVNEFVGRLDNLKPAGGVYRPGVSGPVPGSGMR